MDKQQWPNISSGAYMVGNKLLQITQISESVSRTYICLAGWVDFSKISPNYNSIHSTDLG